MKTPLAAGGSLRALRQGCTRLRDDLKASQNRGIKLSKRAVGQALPILVLPEGGRQEVAPNDQVLTIGTEVHQGAPFLAEARIENCSVLVVQALALHALDDDQAEPRCVELIALTLGTQRIGRIARLEEHFRDGTLIGAVLVDEEPAIGFAGFGIDLLPQPRSAGLLRIRRVRTKAQAGQSHDDGSRKMPSHSKIPAWYSPPAVRMNPRRSGIW